MESSLPVGRNEATRTPDPYVPNVVRYQLRYIPIAYPLSGICGCKDKDLFLILKAKRAFFHSEGKKSQNPQSFFRIAAALFPVSCSTFSCRGRGFFPPSEGRWGASRPFFPDSAGSRFVMGHKKTVTSQVTAENRCKYKGFCLHRTKERLFFAHKPKIDIEKSW